MALDAATIKSKLDAVSWDKRDDTAVTIINAASEAEIGSLDDQAVLLLNDALVGGAISFRSEQDKEALKKLVKATQFQPVAANPDYGVGLIKAAKPGNLAIKNELSSGMVTRIYKAEDKRLSNLERYLIDGKTIGRGQLGQTAFEDVISKKYFKNEWEACVRRLVVSTHLAGKLNSNYQSVFINNNTFKVKFPDNYGIVYIHPQLEDFVVAAYLGIRMIRATKSGRSTKDVARFAVAVYHGMYKMVVAAQTAVKDDVNWAPVEASLIASGRTDEVAYVNEVVT